MIKLNEEYNVNNGQYTIVFSQGRESTITGKYDDGTINGTLEGKVLKGTFHNSVKNAAGLVELTFSENGFSGKWKNGLDPGSMKGKWEGLLKNNISSSKPNLATQLYAYINNHHHIDFDFYEFIEIIKKRYKNIDIQDSLTINEINGDFNGLMNLVNENDSKYLGVLFIFKEYIYSISDGEIYFEIDRELIHTCAYSLEELIGREIGIAKAVENDFDLDFYVPIFISKFISTLFSVFDETDNYELIAELIVSSNSGELGEEMQKPVGDWISDIVTEILSIFQYDVKNYETYNLTINVKYFMSMGLDMGYDYVRLAEDFRDSYI